MSSGARYKGWYFSFQRAIRTYGKRPDDVSLIPWRSGKPVTWNVTVVDTLTESYFVVASATPVGVAELATERTRRYVIGLHSDRYTVNRFSTQPQIWGRGGARESLSVDEPIAIQILLGGTVPQFCRGVGCGTPLNSFIIATICLLEPNCYLYPFTRQSQYKFYLGGRPPIWPRGRAIGGRVWYPMKFPHISYILFDGTEMLSLSVYEPIAVHIFAWGTSPIWPRVEL
jgi:hypothetical protein